MPLHVIRNLCLIGLPLLLAIAAGLHFLSPAPEWTPAFYTIALTANIGYFTNFIAIKMLFKPHYPTALGRQGLIPKNQAKLASALSATLSDHFLTSEHWQEYLGQSHLVPKMLDSTEQYCQDWLSLPENQQFLARNLHEYLQSNQDSLQTLFSQIQSKMISEFSAQIDPQILLNKSFEWVELQFEERPREMEFLIEPVVKTIAENVPMIAERLIDTLDTHIENQDTLRRGIAKAAKWSANINEEDIKHYLFRMVASFEFRQTLFSGLQTLVKEYKQRHLDPNDQSPHLNFGDLLNDFISHQTADFHLTEYLDDKLKEPEIAEQLVTFIQGSLTPLFNWLKRQLTKPEINRALTTQLVRFIEHIDLREIIEEKAAQFSPAKMESIFHNMIRDQLVFIELLGALLGGLSGLALVDIRYFALLSSLFLGYYLLDSFLTHLKNKKALPIAQKET